MTPDLYKRKKTRFQRFISVLKLELLGKFIIDVTLQ